jgi:glycosyltransferase involved in cell wall biosynthesis
VRLLLTSEGHVSRGARGEIYGDGPARYSFWSNYLENFDEVVVLARAAERREISPQEVRADGPSVSFCALPDYNGPWQYLKNLPELKARVREAILRADAYILRVPGAVGHLAWREITRLGRPYALEVVGDPWDALGPGTWPNIFRPVFRHVGTYQLKQMCRCAVAVHYVTQQALQRRYPPSSNAYAVGFSDALMDSAFVVPEVLEKRYKRIEALADSGGNSKQPLRIGFIGSLARMYKGPDVLLRAALLCRRRGLNFEVLLVGAGRHAEEMQALAIRLGIQDQSQFLGQLPSGGAIFDFLDSVDLFVMPSRAEGLPRVLLEAMARACPCIGSAVGGIPELLPPEDLVPAGDAAGLADKIVEVAGNPQRMKEMARRNLEKAREFSPEQLNQVRRDFYRFVRLHSDVETRSSQSGSQDYALRK